MAEQLGFELVHVGDLPPTTRTVTDLENRRIYLPSSSIPGGHGLRSLALQAIAHRVLEHERPASYEAFLGQRNEINYFAAACLMPRFVAGPWLEARKHDRDLAIEDFRDAFGVTHEAAARRFTNLAAVVLGIRCHFLRVQEDGSLYRGYENDGFLLRADVTGAIEGQPVCRWFGARAAFTSHDRATEWYQYTDTPAGTFWCSTQAGATASGDFTVTIGVPFAQSKWFRGRDTTTRRTSTCPDDACCRRPLAAATARWGRRRGRAPACGSTCSGRCRRARSPASTRRTSTTSSRVTRPTPPPGRPPRRADPGQRPARCATRGAASARPRTDG
ncbi:hypothetical protein GCM10025864_23950 [Luteimicrobium album]|uniref:IrrE N-terminal-like domain-containing protein n=1 Tax=Luteimicrobium album TaxID=1054550 RepID=A0ABQ6I1S6_9MICO|nr:hypothetical protein GCM10025864_23950 [Luteimicrobium album]